MVIVCLGPSIPFFKLLKDYWSNPNLPDHCIFRNINIPRLFKSKIQLHLTILEKQNFLQYIT